MSAAPFLRERLAEALGVAPALVTDDLELATLGLSSLEVMEVVYDAEDRLGIVFPEEALESVSTVGELLAAVDAVAGAVAEAAPPAGAHPERP